MAEYAIGASAVADARVAKSACGSRRSRAVPSARLRPGSPSRPAGRGDECGMKCRPQARPSADSPRCHGPARLSPLYKPAGWAAGMASPGPALRNVRFKPTQHPCTSAADPADPHPCRPVPPSGCTRRPGFLPLFTGEPRRPAPDRRAAPAGAHCALARSPLSLSARCPDWTSASLHGGARHVPATLSRRWSCVDGTDKTEIANATSSACILVATHEDRRPLTAAITHLR